MAPLPAERPAWKAAATAAQDCWVRAAGDPRLGEDFRRICKYNLQTVAALAKSV
jgi:hypothetical protein